MEKPAERVRPETKYAPRGLIPDNTSAEAIFAVRGGRPRAKKKTLSSLPSPRPPKAKLNQLQRQDTVVYPPRPRATNLPTTLTMGKGVRTKRNFDVGVFYFALTGTPLLVFLLRPGIHICLL